MWYCSKCGVSNYDDSKFCQHCGTPKRAGQKTYDLKKLVLALCAVAVVALTVWIITLLWRSADNAVWKREPSDNNTTSILSSNQSRDPREAQYTEAVSQMEKGNRFEALNGFFSIVDYRDSQLFIQKILSSPIAGGEYHILRIREDGTVAAIGSNDNGQCNVSMWRNIVSVAACSDHSVGLCSNGTVVATGNNRRGQCNVSGWNDIVAISAGAGYTIGLRSNGTVVTTGIDEDVSSWNNIVSVAAGANHFVGLRSNGTVIAAGGFDGTEECNVSAWKNVVSVAAGDARTVGLRSDGTVVSTGLHVVGEGDTGSWTDIVAVAVADFTTIGLRSNGTVITTNTEINQKTSGWRNVAYVATRNYEPIAMQADGNVLLFDGYLPEDIQKINAA